MAHQLSEDDIMLRLEQYRPTTPGSDWGPDERGIALASALHAEQATRVHYRASNRRARWAAVASGVAARPTGLPDSPVPRGQVPSSPRGRRAALGR